MKKFVSMIAVFTALLIFAVQPAQAQETSATAADLLPPVNIYYEMSTSAENPLEDLFFAEISNEMALSDFSDLAAEKLLEIVKDTTIVTAMEIIPETDIDAPMLTVFTSLYIVEEDFNFLLEELGERIIAYEYNGMPYYSIYDTNNFVFLDGVVFTCNNIEGIEALIDNHLNPENTVLADSEGFENSLANRLENDFFFVYMDPSSYGDIVTASEEDLVEMPFLSFYYDILDAVSAEGISVAQTETGFDFIVYIEGIYEKLEALDLLMDKYNFVPGLYKEVSGKNIILYSEQYNLAESMSDGLMRFLDTEEVAASWEEFETSFAETTGYDFTADVMPLFTGNYLLAVHKDEQVFPAVTMIFQSSADRTKTINMLSAMSNTMKAEFEAAEKESGMEYYSYQIYRAGGASFYQHRFDLTALMGEYSVGAGQYFTLSYTLDGDKLVVSTHSDLDSIYEKDGGMDYNETFKTSYTDRAANLSSIMLFDAEGLKNYLNQVMQTTGASEDEIATMEKLLAPWKTMFTLSRSTATSTLTTGTLNVDIEGLASYEEIFAYMFDGSEYEYDYPEMLPLFDAVDYCDVSVGDWYYPYVNDLTSMAIVSGYEDGCFGPGNEVTRAEFTKMVLGAAEWNGLYMPVAMSDQDMYFNDVPSEAWYWHYVNQAAANGFIKGYNDDTFRPSSPITRAEAVQILYNISPYLQEQTGTEPFEDVSESDWYHTAVAAVYNTGIVNGTSPTTFSPERNLTRAEASKIISKFMFMY